MNPYPYKAEQYINEARSCLQRMRSSKTFSEVNEALVSFLNASRFVFQSWPNEFKNVEGFDTWWQQKSTLLFNDQLCAFFRDLRNRVTKEGYEPFWVNQVIRGPVEIKGPIQIGPQGILKGSVESGRTKWSPVAIEGVSATIGLKEPPNVYTELNPFDLCERYLSFLQEIIDEFVKTFHKG